jgi:hypothetical protein
LAVPENLFVPGNLAVLRKTFDAKSFLELENAWLFTKPPVCVNRLVADINFVAENLFDAVNADVATVFKNGQFLVICEFVLVTVNLHAAFGTFPPPSVTAPGVAVSNLHPVIITGPDPPLIGLEPWSLKLQKDKTKLDPATPPRT